MIIVRRADKAVVAYSEKIPDFLDLPGDLVHIFLRRDTRLFGFLLYLLTVLVRAGEQEYIIPSYALVPCDGIRKHRFVNIADVRLAGGICNCRGNIEFFFHDMFVHLA